jgi:ABC-type multidrug transport system fused ATPase/permease subunit
MLSGGQRRRVALARALLRGSAVLLLDEPTSGLDAESEQAVMTAIERAAAGRMTLVVSHRLRVATLADRVVVLADGRIAEAGTPAELVARDGTFADWCRLQHVDVPPARPLVPMR